MRWTFPLKKQKIGDVAIEVVHQTLGSHAAGSLKSLIGSTCPLLLVSVAFAATDFLAESLALAFVFPSEIQLIGYLRPSVAVVVFISAGACSFSWTIGVYCQTFLDVRDSEKFFTSATILLLRSASGSNVHPLLARRSYTDAQSDPTPAHAAWLTYRAAIGEDHTGNEYAVGVSNRLATLAEYRMMREESLLSLQAIRAAAFDGQTGSDDN